MENLAFLKSKIFSRYYSTTTIAILSLSIVFNMLGVAGDIITQNIAAFLLVLSVVLIVGQILLVLNNVNKSNKVGFILVRFTYATMLAMILGMVSITVGSLIASFYIVGGNSLQASVQFSSIGMTIWTCFGICLSGICHHTNSMEDVWM